MTTKGMNVNDVLAYIQANLNAPKGQYNSFGKYHYRSCEDILGAVKPLLKEAKAFLTITDDIILVGERYYVKATAVLNVGKDGISSIAYAREAMTKKGMDEAQITGSASSYARKYALNGLFAIDDTKDADATNDHGKKTPPKTTPTAPQRNAEPFLQPTPTIDPVDQAKSFIAIIGDAPGMEELKEYFASHWPEIQKLPAELKSQVMDAKNKRKAELEKEMV